MNRSAWFLLPGIVFGVGLAISGMTNPAKVIGFLDFFGQWDPSLACVMGGAITSFVVGNFLVPAPRRTAKSALRRTSSCRNRASRGSP